MDIGNVLILLVLSQIRESFAAFSVCMSNLDIGENDPASKTANLDGETGVLVMMYQNEYLFTCCGFVYMWEFWATTTNTGSFDAQVWRPVSLPYKYELVGFNTITPANRGNTETKTINNGQRIRVNENDYIGMFSKGAFQITNKNEGGGQARLKYTSYTSLVTSQQVDYTWADNTNHDYAINAFVTPSLPPIIPTLSDITLYNDEVPVGTNLAYVVLTDPDLEDANSLTLILKSSTNSGTTYFKISTGTWNITVKAVPPIGTYTLTLEAEDPCTLKNTGDQKIKIINRIPVIENIPNTISISEDTTVGTLIYTFNATDTVTVPVTCSITGGTNSLLAFTIQNVPPTSTTFGVYIKTGATLDYDTYSTYSAVVSCDDGTDTVKATLTVNLIRNIPPVINSLPTTIKISEDLATRTLLHELNVTDAESDVVTCVLTTYTSLFEVTKVNGVYGIFLKGGTALNYDVISSYVLSVTCSDKRRNDTEKLTVDLIRNEPPSIVNLPMSCETPEYTISETLLYTVSVTDPTNDTVTCTLLTFTSTFYIQLGKSLFEYDVYSRSSPGFDYDVKRSYSLNIECKDIRRSVSSVFYVYLLRNKPPTFLNIQGKTAVSALTAEAGTVVYTVRASDPENDQLQYLMTTPPNAPFSINQNTGEISLSRSIKTESVTGYDLSIRVSDKRNLVGPSTLTILIKDINSPPVLINLPQTVSILEGIALGSLVFQPRVDDKNILDIHTFSVVFNPPEGAVYFKVDKTDGHVTTNANIDYETISSKTFLITITVTDSFMSDNGTLTLNIINVNEAPKFTKKSYAFSNSEGKAGTVLQNPYYQYTDEDGDAVKFSLDCGSNTGRLDINKATGFFTYAVDYDLDVSGTDSNVLCQVFIGDKEYTDSAFMNITIFDINDNNPIFQHKQYVFFKYITTEVGTNIGKVYATDGDLGHNGTINYYIEQGTIATSIFIVDIKGSITIKKLLTTSGYTDGSTLSFKVYAEDPRGQLDFSTIDVVILDTSVPSTTTESPILYKTFFTHAPNMAWFVPLLFALFITVCVVVHTIYVCVEKIKKQKRLPRRRRTRY